MAVLAASALCTAARAADDDASPLVCSRGRDGQLSCMPRVLLDAQRPRPATAAAAELAPTWTLYLATLAPRGDLSTGSVMGLMAEQMAQGAPPGASRFLQQGALAQSAQSPLQQIEALGRIGRTQAQAGDHAAASQSFQDALALARRAGDADGEAAMLVNSSVVRAARGDYPAALDGLRKAHGLYRDLTAQLRNKPLPAEGDRTAQLRQAMARKMQADSARLGQELALIDQGAIQAYLGQYQEAFGSYEQALALYPNGAAPAGAGTVLRGLAQTSRQLGRSEESRRYAERAAEAGSSLIEEGNQAMANGRIELGRKAQAATPVRAAPGTAGAAANETAAPSLAYQAPASLQQGRFEAEAADAEARRQPDAAISGWRKASVAAELVGSADGLRNALAQLQRLSARQQQPALAAFYGKRAVNEIQRQRGQVAAMGRDASRAYASRARPVYEALIDTLQASGRLAEAEQAMRLQQADAAGPEGSAGRMPYTLAEQALLQRDAALAARWRDSAQALAAQAAASPTAGIMPTSEQAMQEMRDIRLASAEQLLDGLEPALAGPGGAQSRMALGMMLPSIEAMVAPAPCGAQAVDARTRALAARLARLRAQAGSSPMPSGMTGMTGLVGAMALSGQMPGTDALFVERLWCAQQAQNAIEQAYGMVDAALVQGLQAPQSFAAPELALLEGNRQRLAAAPAGTVTLQYLVGEKRLRILLVTAQGRVAREVAVDRSTLDALVERYRNVLRKSDEDPLAPAQALHRLLIAPLLPELDGARTLILALDGRLRYLPFAALHDGRQWLVERYALALGSPQPKAASAPQRAWRVAGFGSTQGGFGLPPLPAVAQELSEVVRDDAQSRKDLLPGIARLDRAFTAQALRDALAQRYPVVHIASHFNLDAGDAASSFLLLGDGSKLSLQTIRRDYRFDGVELLTLSACQTGLDTDNAYGQEFEGLAAILRAQGAAAVLASLWSVNDASTGLLMGRFYAAHEQDKLSRAEALRAAQRQLIGGLAAPVVGADGTKRGVTVAGATAPVAPAGASGAAGSFTHPYFWAPFVLMGDWL